MTKRLSTMRFEPIRRILKNGQPVLIREAVPADASALLATVKTYIQDSESIPLKPGEFQLAEEDERAWIDSFTRSDNSLLLVAVYEDRIIGNIDLTGSPRHASRHTGVIGMGMLQEWRNTGLGTALLKAVIGWARQNPVLEILWLQVYADNIAGRALYHKAGFTECGVQKGFFRNRRNEYVDNVTMMMEVKW